MHPGAKTILANTNVLLLKQLLQEINWPDSSLADDLAAGMPLVGEVPTGGVFLKQAPKATLTVPELMKSCKTMRAKLVASIGPSDSTLDLATLKNTNKELQDGTMLGPYSLGEVERLVGPLFLPARRFTIQQGEKPNEAGVMMPAYRCIDDYSEVGHNSAAVIREKIDVQGSDVSIANARGWLTAVDWKTNVVTFTFSDGVVNTGVLHEAWKGGLNLKGYLADLKKAYRQVPRRESQRWVSFIAFWHTILNKVMFAEHLGQPFGSSAAVNNFNRLGRALQALFVKLLQVCTCNIMMTVPE